MLRIVCNEAEEDAETPVGSYGDNPDEGQRECYWGEWLNYEYT